VLDKQIIDINGKRVVRVNDLQFAYVNGKYRLVAVDATPVGLARRLGMDRPIGKLLKIGGRDSRGLIPWDQVDPTAIGPVDGGLEPARLLAPRRAADVGNDLWRTLNVVQENVLHGGIPRRTASNRLVRTRAITAIREDVRINSGLWDLALSLVA
jgi:sporulation protein YlmC with PRC-barrel domain